MITFIDIHIYDDIGADKSVKNALARARYLGIPCFTIGKLVTELTIDDVQEVQEGRHHQVLSEENVDDVEVEEDDQEERQRLQDQGNCPRCIDHYMARENAQPNWCVEGCPSCYR